MEIRDLIRENIRDLVPYEPHLYSDVIKLDANENPYPFPLEVMREIFSRAAGDIFTRYPDPGGQGVKKKIASLVETDETNIVLGNGSDELILLIMQTFGGPGTKAIIPVPTFSMYKIHAQISETTPVEVPRDDNFNLNMKDLLHEVRKPETRITFIATPNNPTGNDVSLAQIEELLEAADSLVVVDEAYIDFGGDTALPLLKKHPNLVVLRTLSKVGLAGLRMGYLVAGNAVTRELLKVKQPYNVNAFSQLAATVMLEYWPLFKKQIEEIISERERLQTELAKMKDIRVFPSRANFILFQVAGEAAKCHRYLLENGILVRYGLGKTHGLDQCLRVTVGTREENNLFLEKMTSRK